MKLKKVVCAILVASFAMLSVSSMAYANGEEPNDGMEMTNAQEISDVIAAESLEEPVVPEEPMPEEPVEIAEPVIPEAFLEYATAEELEEMLEISEQRNIPLEMIPGLYNKYLHIICRPFTGTVTPVGPILNLDGYDGFFSSTFTKVAEEEIANDDPDLKRQTVTAYGITCYVNYKDEYISTPKGSLVAARFYYNDITEPMRTAYNASANYNYPNAVQLGDATINYNCHSYAWYYGNCWIDDPQSFYSDYSYDEVTSPQPGDIVFYSAGALSHSGVVYSVSDSGAITVVSKWGMYGLYMHDIDYCPYDTSNIHYYRPHSHSYTYISIDVHAGHRCTCACGQSFTESHTWVTAAGGYRCPKCKFFTKAIPVTPDNIPAEILEKIEEYASMDEYAFAVDDDTIFCCIDGNYYYVSGADESEALTIAKDFADPVVDIYINSSVD